MTKRGVETSTCVGAAAREKKSAQLVQMLARSHVGRNNGIGADQLAKQLGIVTRVLRQLISAAREEGIAVCGTPATGYYVAETQEDLEQTCRFLRDRAMHSLTLESRLRKMALPELLGQLRINT